MYKGTIKFVKRETLKEEFIINIGIFNRPSTAERFRKQLQDAKQTTQQKVDSVTIKPHF